MPSKRIAIVYDWIDKWGGVERILIHLHNLFPDATFYTSYVDYTGAPWAKHLPIKTSFIQRLPKFIRSNRLLSLIVYPYAFESFDFSEYDVVLSISSSFAKGVITKPSTTHVAYILTPTRFLWIFPTLYVKNVLFKSFAMPWIRKLLEWDFIAAQRPDKLLSLSQTTAERCRKYYRRESSIVYPPFSVDYWRALKLKGEDDAATILTELGVPLRYFLIVSRLEQYKNIELAVEAFNKREDMLVVVGQGSQRNMLQKKSHKNILFLPSVSEQQLSILYQHAQALIMPQEEDFGYVSLEAQVMGCPIIAYKKGGATETIIENSTGIFFDRQDAESLGNAIARFSPMSYNVRQSLNNTIEKHLKKFDSKKFEEEIKAIITNS